MNRVTPALVLVVLMPLFSLMLGGCAMTREDRLRARSDKIAGSLIGEREHVMAMPTVDPQRAARLSHLTTLRTTLSAVNIGLGSVRYLPETNRDLAYDVVDEAYSTIEWNIPLGPGDAMRSMPPQFSNGELRLN